MPVDKSLAKKDPAELSAEEAELLAIQRSNVSLDEYNPEEVAADEIVVQGPNRETRAAKDFVEDENADPGVVAEAQGAVDSARLARGEDVPAAGAIGQPGTTSVDSPTSTVDNANVGSNSPTGDAPASS